MCCFLVLGVDGLIPLWLVLAVIFRDLVIISGALLYNYRVAEVEAAPILMSKVNTALQILLVVAVILDAGVVDLPEVSIAALIWACLITVVVSGAQYVWIWSHKAIANGRKPE